MDPKENTLPPMVFLVPLSEWVRQDGSHENQLDWETLRGMFAKQGFLLRRAPEDPDALLEWIATYHPDAALVHSDWAMTGIEGDPIRRFDLLSARLPTVAVITQNTYTQFRGTWFDILYDAILREYVHAPFCIEEITVCASKVIAANRIEAEERQALLRQARALWDAGQPAEAGRLIYARIPRQAVPGWAAGILETAAACFPPSPSIQAVLDFARSPQQWAQPGEDYQRAARQIVEAADAFPLPAGALLAELARDVGRVTYNMYGYVDPYDPGAGWRIAQTLKEILREVGDPALEERAWHAMCSEGAISLKLPWITGTAGFSAS